MKGLKKIALVSAIAAASAGAQAELKALDDSAMGELTGQAGLTIDIETEWTIGEFAYHDAGVVVLKDLSMGGNSNEGTNTMLDNIRLTLDVAGAGVAGDNVAAYGMSEVKGLAAVHYGALKGSGLQAEADFGAAAAGAGTQQGLSIDVTDNLRIDDERVHGDGDLVLHFGFTDAWQKSAAGSFAAFSADPTNFATTSYADARDMAARAVDFEFNIGQIALADSTYADTAGTRLGTETIQKTDHANGTDTDAGGATTTTLISDLSMKGYYGPMDIAIQNNGNGFSGGPTAGSGAADSKIQWDSFFKVTDLDLYIDIAGVQLTDIKIHNVRGDKSSLNTVTYDASGTPTTVNTASFGFAHSKREIYAVKDAVLNLHSYASGGPLFVDGIAINTEFKGDIDIGALSFGDTGTSIGSIYLTDIESTTNWTISAH